MPKVRDYFLHGSEKILAKYSHNSEKDVVEKYFMYYNFYIQGNISLSSSMKVLKESKKNMQKYCGISEFYNGSRDLDYLKTETIALLFSGMKEEHLNTELFKLENFKKCINLFLDGELIKDDGYAYTTRYLNYLKGIRHIWDSNESLKRGNI